MPLKAIWLAALQPCGARLKACLPDWLPAYEADHRRLDPDMHRAGAARGLHPFAPLPEERPGHDEQKHYTNVRLWFGYARYDHAEVGPLINALCRGALDQLLNYFLPTMKRERKERVGSRTVRRYRPTRTPLERVLACAEVSEEARVRLRAEKAALNPFGVRREVDRQLKAIEAVRRPREA